MAERNETECRGKLDEWDVLEFTAYPRTGIGTSKLFADKYKNELRFVRELGLYFYYNGKEFTSVFRSRHHSVRTRGIEHNTVSLVKINDLPVNHIF